MLRKKTHHNSDFTEELEQVFYITEIPRSARYFSQSSSSKCTIYSKHEFMFPDNLLTNAGITWSAHKQLMISVMYNCRPYTGFRFTWKENMLLKYVKTCY